MLNNTCGLSYVSQDGHRFLHSLQKQLKYTHGLIMLQSAVAEDVVRLSILKQIRSLNARLNCNAYEHKCKISC